MFGEGELSGIFQNAGLMPEKYHKMCYYEHFVYEILIYCNKSFYYSAIIRPRDCVFEDHGDFSQSIFTKRIKFFGKIIPAMIK